MPAETGLPASPSITQSLAARLLRVIFGSYFLVTLVVTSIQLVAEYRHVRDRLLVEIAAMEYTFGPGITDAVWGFNSKVLQGILAGMIELPSVVGAKVVNERGELLLAIGVVQDGEGRRFQAHGQATLDPLPANENKLFDQMLSKTFDLVHVDENGDGRPIGLWTVYSSESVVLREIEYGFFLILVNSVLKTLALWIIFLFVIRRMLGRPLRQLTDFVAGLNIDNLEGQQISLKSKGHHELVILADKLNHMVGSLRDAVARNKVLYEGLKTMNQTLESQVAKRTRELEELASTDKLTGLVNRRKLDEVLNYEFSRKQRYGGELSVVLCDVDKFKSVNDLHGHQVGDEVLAHLAALLRHSARATDTVGRWGGEEFLLVCPDTDLLGAYAMAEHLRLQVLESKFPHTGNVTCSFGVAQLKRDEDLKTLLMRVDSALYHAKAAGRNRVEQSET